MPEMSEEQRKELEEKLKNMSPEEIAELQKQQCIFCQIVSGKIPSKTIYDDDKVLVVLDINPATKGHLLVIPKTHYAIMPQIPDEELGHYFVVSKFLSQLLLKNMKATGTNLFIANGQAAGQRAQHFMLHIIPRKDGDGILDAESKLIEADMVAKVMEGVKPKLFELLGVKEEVQTTLEKDEDDDIEEETDDLSEEDDNSEPGEEDNDEKSEDEDQETQENDDSEDGVEDDEQDDSEESEKNDESDEDEGTEEEDSNKKPTKDKRKGGDDVSLDDIANLFQ